MRIVRNFSKNCINLFFSGGINASAEPSAKISVDLVAEDKREETSEQIAIAALKYADDTNYVAFYVDDLVKNGYLCNLKIKSVRNDYRITNKPQFIVNRGFL